MREINQKAVLSTHISEIKKAGKSIGFIPTMGALHAGHLSLVKQARAQCDVVVVSIFVNPTQFNNPADLEKYPRTMETDLAQLKMVSPDCLVFVPSAKEIYGGPVVARHFDFGPLAEEMEGKFRSGHFDGVGTVLQIFFDIVKPDKAFFGEKDFQQLQIVRKLVEITGQPVQIVGCTISRENNGLARSSRNERLSPEQRAAAALIYQTLQGVKTHFGTKNATFITRWVQDQFEKNPYLKLEYFEIADEKTLQSIQQGKKDAPYRAFIAVYAGNIRLIDNIALH